MANTAPRQTHTRLILTDSDAKLDAMIHASTLLEGYSVEPLPSSTPEETASTLQSYRTSLDAIVHRNFPRPQDSYIDPVAATEHAKLALEAGGHIVKLVIQTTPNRPRIDSKPFFDLVDELQQNKDSK